MDICPLEHIPVSALVDVLNRAFADYVVPLQVDEAQLRRKLVVEGIDLELSRGAFDEGRLVGFMLHGVDEWEGERLLYNGGTGVLPAYRRRGFVSSTYRELQPELRRRDFRGCLLEVIAHNDPAVSAYEKTGFQYLRTVSCLQGRPLIEGDIDIEARLAPLPADCYDRLPDYWTFRPTWQYGPGALRRGAAFFKAFGLFRDELLLVYGVLDDAKGRVQSFGVHPEWRGKGLGRRLFREFADTCDGPLTVINVDSEDAGTLEFLRRLGFRTQFQQYEMKWLLG